MSDYLFDDGRIITVDDKEPAVKCRCPFCGGTYEAFFSTDGDGFVVHTEPHCERFAALEPVDFMAAARRAGAVEMS